MLNRGNLKGSEADFEIIDKFAVRSARYSRNSTAEVAELVDAHDSNSCAARRVGSIPTFGTKKRLAVKLTFFVLKKLSGEKFRLADNKAIPI